MKYLSEGLSNVYLFHHKHTSLVLNYCKVMIWKLLLSLDFGE